jgi:hypothetical protein
MRKYLMIVTAILFLNSTTELHQLLRLPLLFNHYTHHKTENADLSLLVFLKLHYTGNHPSDNDDKDDKELPFKSADITHTDIPLDFYKETELVQPLYIKDTPPSKHTEGMPSNRVIAVFRPPRLS